MKMYLAAAYQRQAEMRMHRAALQELGHVVTSRWLDNIASDELTAGKPNEAWCDYALTDVSDVHKADALISFTSPSLGRGGRHVEYGMAIALGMERVIVGPIEHVFHMLPGTILLAGPRELMEWASAR